MNSPTVLPRRSEENLLHPKYRPDIDGLRALAVLSVVLYHAFPSKLKGGFVGVDIFFVISGYLISTIIFTNLERGTFSFAAFYSRRVKRIFPALLLVLLFCFVFGWHGLLSDEFRQLGKHIAAGAGFLSNFVLWGESGYFDNAGHSKPLLHLWSLGIEEQFYIFWPLLVWIAWRSKLGLLLISLSALLISFSLNIHGVRNDPVATFYSPLTRFWELSVGSILAYLTLRKHINPTRTAVIRSNALSIAGIALLFSAVLFTNSDLTFPGWWALLPVFGSALVIVAGTKSWLNRKVFSNKLAVWFGLISFPLYLWHWPILSFGRIVEGDGPSRIFRVLAILTSIILAWVTYRFIERYVRVSKGYKYVFLLVSASVVVALAGTFVYVNNGLTGREIVTESGFNEEVRRQFTGPWWGYTRIILPE